MNDLRDRLEAAGLRTDVVSRAATGSRYLRFEVEEMGKIRIGDHSERERYGYRWQIRTDISEPRVDETKGHRRFFYPSTALDEAVRHMVNYYRKIKKGIPK